MHAEALREGTHRLTALVGSDQFADLIIREEPDFLGLQPYRAGILGSRLFDDGSSSIRLRLLGARLLPGIECFQ